MGSGMNAIGLDQGSYGVDVGMRCRRRRRRRTIVDVRIQPAIWSVHLDILKLVSRSQSVLPMSQ
jgi:hypothetical protein